MRRCCASSICSLHSGRRSRRFGSCYNKSQDQLMTGVFTPASDITTELIEANGVVIHVTSSSRCTSTHGSSFPDQIVLLVHGGLYMSGSYHASAHLAAKLCDMLDVPVADAKMRLAPGCPSSLLLRRSRSQGLHTPTSPSTASTRTAPRRRRRLRSLRRIVGLARWRSRCC